MRILERFSPHWLRDSVRWNANILDGRVGNIARRHRPDALRDFSLPGRYGIVRSVWNGIDSARRCERRVERGYLILN